MIHIKYGAENFPGSKESNYDEVFRANEYGYLKMEYLKKGSYYLYVTGYAHPDSSWVRGGAHVRVASRDSENTVVINSR